MSDAEPLESRTTYERATAHYDAAFEAALVCEISAAIARASRVSDANAVVIRTGELISAVTTILAGAIALSPHASGSPTKLRKAIDEISKDLRRQVAAARADPDVQDFVRRCFRGTDTEGCA